MRSPAAFFCLTLVGLWSPLGAMFTVKGVYFPDDEEEDPMPLVASPTLDTAYTDVEIDATTAGWQFRHELEKYWWRGSLQVAAT